VEVTAKFAIWNAGPGMDNDELLEISNTRLPSARKKSDEQLGRSNGPSLARFCGSRRAQPIAQLLDVFAKLGKQRQTDRVEPDLRVARRDL
jgi:hypothetical protein